MSELKHSKLVRGSYKGHCTQDIKPAERVMEDANSPNMTELKAIVARLSRRIEEISILDNNIVKALEKEEDIMEETDQTQDIIHYGVLKINEFIAKNNRR